MAPAAHATFRPPRDEDRASVIGVAAASGLFPSEELADVAATLDGFLTGAAEADRWVIDDTGTTAAAAAYYAPERMTDGTWNLYMLAVHPDHQRQGRGARLVRHVEKELAASGARVLLIETSGVPDFAGQRAFYLGLGYTEEARIRDFYERGDDKVVYWKDLASDDHRVDGPTSSPAGTPPSVREQPAVLSWNDGRWTAQPRGVRAVGQGLAVEAVQGSDYWRHTLYGFVHDDGHALLVELPEEKAVEVSFDMAGLTGLYDQAGVLLQAGEDQWIKAGIEMSDGVAHLGAVVTDGTSDWSMSPLAGWDGTTTIRLSRLNGAVVVRARTESQGWRTVRVAPIPTGGPLHAGPMVCAPTRAGLEVTFRSWRHTEPDSDLHTSPPLLR